MSEFEMNESDVSQAENVVEADPFSFLKHPRTENRKRSIADRRGDFNEIYVTKADEELQSQASRCLDCGNPYCEWKCPLHNYIPNWLELVKNQKFDQAAELMHETNPLPEICGRVCPQDRLCEQACTLNTGFGAVNIGAIEKNISDLALAKKWRPNLKNRVFSDKKVAIVGAGPAGLGCAELLARNGIKPVVFDRYPEIGGLLTFGIPGFKLEKDIIVRRREFLEDIGVEFRLNTEIGKDVTFDSLQAEFDAQFLAMGCYTGVTGELPGANGPDVLQALDYLIGNVNQQQAYQMSEYPYYHLTGKKVVVLGGGDTAMDCVRSALRQQAQEVFCVYRRDQAAMPGSPSEVKNAIEEGGNFVFNRQPLSIERNVDGSIKGVLCATTRIQSKGNGERAVFEVLNEQTQLIEADCVILAFGFNPSPADWFESIALQTSQNGLVKTGGQSTLESSLQSTSCKGVFAGGDMVSGADLVVTAIAQGRQAAQEILAYLSK